MNKLTDKELVNFFASLAAKYGDAATRRNADEHCDAQREGVYDRDATEAAICNLLKAIF